MCHYLTSNRQFSLLAAPLPLSAVPPPQSAESSRLWVFYYCELPKYFYISTELFSGTNLFSVYWHGHGGQGDSKPSQVRLWKRDKWGCWGRSYSSYTQNVCYNWLYKWYNQTRWHHKTYVSHFLKKKKFSTWIFESLSNHNVRCDKNGLYYYPKNKLLRVLLHSICNIFKHCVDMFKYCSKNWSFAFVAYNLFKLVSESSHKTGYRGIQIFIRQNFYCFNLIS